MACSFIYQPTWRAQRSKYDVNFFTQEHFNHCKRSVFGGTKATDIKLSVDDAWPCNTSKHNETLLFSYKWSQHRRRIKTFEFISRCNAKCSLCHGGSCSYYGPFASARQNWTEFNWTNWQSTFWACSELVQFSSSNLCRGDVNRPLRSCAVSKSMWLLAEKFPILSDFVVREKGATLLLPLTLPNADRFSKIFHHQTYQYISGISITKYPTKHQMRRCTTLWNVCAEKSLCPKTEWNQLRCTTQPLTAVVQNICRMILASTFKDEYIFTVVTPNVPTVRTFVNQEERQREKSTPAHTIIAFSYWRHQSASYKTDWQFTPVWYLSITESMLIKSIHRNRMLLEQFLPATRQIWSEFFIFGRPFVKRSPYAIGPLSVCLFCLSVSNVGVLRPNGWMDEDKTWHGGRPRPQPNCGMGTCSRPPPKRITPLTFRPMSIVAKRLDGSRFHLVRR